MKDQQAFDAKVGTCYVTEDETAYTYQDILDDCHGKHALAELVFGNVDGVHPSTEVDQLEVFGEIDDEGNFIDVTDEDDE